ncbi:hypothetical protein [Microvirga makkahensis]|uniref:Uncharacterized protein n=1 Tax=Microvirga makkahensis TaxID=1128670 RepID=A0A7X3MSK7_9HYPH|nr:hypothetical protein [Microvirga makkahensis]MXQ12476.1 hypothetical protein [Microvirga makkahensis]
MSVQTCGRGGGVALPRGVWRLLQLEGLPEGLASGNGRIGAVGIDIAAKSGGRATDILVKKGEFVRAGRIPSPT